MMRFNNLDQDTRDDFRRTLLSFCNAYVILAQIIPFQDSDLEKLYSYIRFLHKKLPKGNSGPSYDFDGEVALKYYRLQKISEGSIELESGQGNEVSGPTTETAPQDDTTIELSQLIDILNERFGTHFTKADQLFFDTIEEDAISNPELRQVAKANSMENFGTCFP